MKRFAMPHKVLQRTYSTRFNDFALEFYSFVADNYAPFYSRPVECRSGNANDNDSSPDQPALITKLDSEPARDGTVLRYLETGHSGRFAALRYPAARQAPPSPPFCAEIAPRMPRIGANLSPQRGFSG